MPATSRDAGGGVMTGMRRGAVMLGLAAVTAVAGCRGAPTAQSPEAVAGLRRSIDGVRVCAPLLSASWPIAFSTDSLATPGVDALVAAGLVRRVSLPDPAGDNARTRIAITATGLRDVRLHRLSPESPPQPQLCFGRKQVTTLHQASTGDRSGTVDYAYRIIDAPRWTTRADIRAAFPFMVDMLKGELHAQDGTMLSSGRWNLATGAETQAVAEMSNKGFFPCPAEGGERDSPCR